METETSEYNPSDSKEPKRRKAEAPPKLYPKKVLTPGAKVQWIFKLILLNRNMILQFLSFILQAIGKEG